MRRFDLRGDVFHDGRTDIVGAARLSEGLTAEFDKNAFEFPGASVINH
jgi:hypothetical protein